MPTTRSPQESLTSATQLDELVALISARFEAGEPVDLAALTADCPQLRERLEMLLPTLEAVVELERCFAHTTGRAAASADSILRSGAAAGLSSSAQAAVVRGSPDPAHAASRSGATAGLSSSAQAAVVRVSPDPAHAASSHGLLGDFRILREVGRGGMGVVYEAEQISLGRRVALKVLPFAAMLDRQQLARFKNEARAAATLDHPNIVAIYSVGCERGVHYYAMQLIEGQSLAQVVEQLKAGSKEQGAKGDPDCSLPLHGEGLGEGSSAERGSPDPAHPASSIDTEPVARLTTLPNFSSKEYFKTIAQLGIQAAEALDHAHQNGVLHRDIKPANLLVEGDCPAQ